MRSTCRSGSSPPGRHGVIRDHLACFRCRCRAREPDAHPFRSEGLAPAVNSVVYSSIFIAVAGQSSTDCFAQSTAASGIRSTLTLATSPLISYKSGQELTHSSQPVQSSASIITFKSVTSFHRCRQALGPGTAGAQQSAPAPLCGCLLPCLSVPCDLREFIAQYCGKSRRMRRTARGLQCRTVNVRRVRIPFRARSRM